MNFRKLLCLPIVCSLLIVSFVNPVLALRYKETEDIYDTVLNESNSLKDLPIFSYDSPNFNIFDFLFSLFAKRMSTWPDYPARYEFFDGEMIEDFYSVVKGLTTADFDGDGDLDFAVSHYTGNSCSLITIFYNEGDGSEYSQEDVFSHDGMYPKISSIISELDAADFDGDGDVDILYTYCE